MEEEEMTFIEQVPRLPIIIGNFISIIPLMLYITFFDKKDDGHWLGWIGQLLIKGLRRLR
jgi:hypothetical protein